MIALKTYTMQEYVEFTDRMPGRFEYAHGQIFAVESPEPVEESLIDYVLSPYFDLNQVTAQFPIPTQLHDILVSNLHGLLFAFFRGKSYRVYSQFTKVVIEWAEKSRMPDILVVKKDVESRTSAHQVTNPIVMMEVLSKSTQSIDKTEKLEEYQSLPSLQEYVLISQTQIRVVVYRRINSHKWEMEIIDQADGIVTLSSLGCELPARDIYEDVDFETISN